ncbi:MAG: hypothetical protein SF123_20090 [Chloroflexota bacterium]|nr:hypothetical protein [Chloroflexota bacterium]
MRLNRSLSLIALVAYVVIIVAAFQFVLSQASTIRETVGDSEIVILMEPRLVLPGGCTSVRWSFSHTRLRNLDGMEIAPEGSEQFCPSIPVGRQFNIITDEGLPYEVTAFVGIFPRGTRVLVGLMAALAGFGVWVLFVALVGDLPLLSPTVRRLLLPVVDFIWVRRLHGLWLQAIAFGCSRDALAITGLGILLTLPLILARFDERLNTPVVLIIGLGGGLSLAVWWLAKSHRRTTRTKTAAQSLSPDMLFIVSGTLLVCTVAGYYLPMQHQFWAGGDEIWVLENATKGWDVFREYDLRFGRPLTPLGSPLAGNLTSTGVDGYLWFAAAVRLITGALLYGVVRQLLPRSGALPLAAAVLFIVSPTEGSRFLAVYMQGYTMPVMFTLLALYLYLRSLARDNRMLLLLACFVLAMGLLSVEVTYLASLLIPVLLVLRYRRHPRLFTWLFAWFVTMSLFALRFLIFLLRNRETNYQLELASAATPLEGLTAQLLPTLEYLRIVDALPGQWVYGGLVALVVILGLVYVFRHAPIVLSRRQWVLAFALCGGGLLLTIVPYVLLPVDSVLSDSFRTQYFAAPIQAILWSLVLACVGIVFFRASAQRWLVGVVGVLVAMSVVNNLTADVRRSFNPNTRFENVAHFVEQVRTIAPGFTPETFLVFVFDEGVHSPIGWNYSIFMMSRSVLGAPGVMVGSDDQLGATYQILDFDVISNNWGIAVAPSQLVMFAVDADGGVRLLNEVPSSILAEPEQAAALQIIYDPQTRITTTPFTSPILRFFEIQQESE